MIKALYILLLCFVATQASETTCKYPNIKAYDTVVRACDQHFDGPSLHKECRGTPINFSAKIQNNTIIVYGCSAEVTWRTKHSGDYSVFREPAVLEEKQTFAYVKCGDSNPIYLIKPAKAGRVRNGVSNKDKKNVFVVMLDALSWEALQIYMPVTLDVVKKARSNFDVTEFTQYSAVGSNSFPNKFRLFGEYTFVEERLREPNTQYNHTWIWEYAKMQGYWTVYSESYCPDPVLETQKDFNVQIYGHPTASIGHHEQPDVVLIEEMCAENRTMQNSCMERKWTNEYVKDFMTELIEDTSAIPIDERAPMFVYNNFADPHTDNQWGTAVADHNVAEYLLTILQSPLMDNGVIYFLSDHGLHYGSYQATSIFGYAENRHPFLFTITKKGESGIATKNQNRLVTPMDIHHMFRNTIGLPPTKIFDTYNLFTDEVPFDRTCESAGIPSDYCLCTYETDKRENYRLKCNVSIPGYLWSVCENDYSNPAIFDWKYYLSDVLIPMAKKNGGTVEETECFSTIHWCAYGLSCHLNGARNFSPMRHLYSLPEEQGGKHYCYNWPETFNCNWGYMVRDYLRTLPPK